MRTKASRRCFFFGGDEVCEVSYADRGGKYMKQRGITTPKA